MTRIVSVIIDSAGLVQCPHCQHEFEVVEHIQDGARAADKVKVVSEHYRMILMYLLDPESTIKDKTRGRFFHDQVIYPKADLAKGFVAAYRGTEFVKIANAGTWDFKISVLVRKEILRKCKFPDRKQTVYYYIRKSDVAQAINSGVFS